MAMSVYVDASPGSQESAEDGHSRVSDSLDGVLQV